MAVTARKILEVCERLAVVDIALGVAKVVLTWSEVQAKLKDGSFGVAVRVIVPPLPHKLAWVEVNVMGVTVTVTCVLGPSHVPLLSDT